MCGKVFTKGALDLARHQAGTTVQHIVSTKRTSTCIHECSKCHSFFTQEEHLQMHKEFSSCKSSRKSKLTDFFTPKPMKEAKDQIDSSSSPSKGSKSTTSTTPRTSGVDKTMECMVCGKLFSRGKYYVHASAYS